MLCGVQSSVRFDSLVGETYYVRVSGFEGPLDKLRSPVGMFGLTVQSLGGAVNDRCQDAIEIQPGNDGEVVISGSTAEASDDIGLFGCWFDYGSYDVLKGVWFVVRGSGGIYRAQVSQTPLFRWTFVGTTLTFFVVWVTAALSGIPVPTCHVRLQRRL